MNLNECSHLFDAGLIKQARIVPSIGQPGWYLELSGRHAPFNITRQRGGDCVYKTIDVAWRAAYKIGFREVSIEHSGMMLDYL